MTRRFYRRGDRVSQRFRPGIGRLAAVRPSLYAGGVGIISELQYSLPRPNAAQRAMWHISSSRPGAWLFARSLPPVDRSLLRLSKGKLTLAGLTAGIPVLTITTTGARSGLRRTSPLLGVPVGDDIAVIGTHFGQASTPAWYYNLLAEPRVEVAFRDRTVTATAREAGTDEWQQAWDEARKIYAGYDAYARRIKDRKIHIMLLSAEAAPAR
jgi:deazaflavin-dependent oxidoreductase (nitroreductase family)